MIQEFREDEGMDPGLGDLAYDGAEYEVDEFGERIGSDDMFEDDATEEEDAVAEMSPQDTSVEDAFGETINQDNNPHLEDQLEDPSLSDEALADYESASGMGEDKAEEDHTEP